MGVDLEADPLGSRPPKKIKYFLQRYIYIYCIYLQNVKKKNIN